MSRRPGAREAATRARFRAAVAAADDLNTPKPTRDVCRQERSARRTVRRMLRTGHLIGDAA